MTYSEETVQETQKALNQLLYTVYDISSQICDIFGNMRTSDRSIEFTK